jgi:hypothetical protein
MKYVWQLRYEYHTAENTTNQPTHHMKPNATKPNPNEQNQPPNNSNKQPPALVHGYIINL